jgi:FlaA1/EpsC-like NDP-sugar epimerase
MNDLSLISRKQPLFYEDIKNHEKKLLELVKNSNFLVIGGAGSIGQAVCKEIFKRQPKRLHVVDLSENNLVELVRDLRSSNGYINGEFKTFAIDVSSIEFKLFFKLQEDYDFILNLSALKHVRSEKDPFTLMRMFNTNIFSIVDTIRLAQAKKVKKYFCVSTDKAANPVNLMGASKKIMEMFLNYESKNISISSARFANVAFSDGSLLHGLNQRIIKEQPISAPIDIKRYFISSKEAGELCLMSCLLGNNNDIFFPKENSQLQLTDFISIVSNYLRQRGYEPFLCQTEDEARKKCDELIKIKKWPCFFFKSDTTGEKPFEEFYTKNETVYLKKFIDVGIVKNNSNFNVEALTEFYEEFNIMRSDLDWDKLRIIKQINKLLPEFIHNELNKNLDQRM